MSRATTNPATLAETLEELAYQAGTIAAGLDVLEMALYYASEREDMDMTKPGAASASLLSECVKRFQNDILELRYTLTDETA